MKQLRLITLAAAVALSSACIPSLNPFYTSADLRFETRLLGEWRQENTSDGPGLWAFEKAGDQAYQLTVTEKGGKRGKFRAHLFHLDDKLFLDIVPMDCQFDPDQADLVGFAVFPGHLLIKVAQLEPTLKIYFCDYDWLSKFLEQNPMALEHHSEEKRLILTASTRDLQQFVRSHGGTNELFREPTQLIRQPEGTP